MKLKMGGDEESKREIMRKESARFGNPMTGKKEKTNLLWWEKARFHLGKNSAVC
jgi:hypothetical protein